MHYGLAAYYFAPAHPQYDDYGGTEHEFQRRPEHSHQADQAQAAADVFLVGAFEGGDLGLLLHIGADDAGAGEVFLGAGRDVRKHGLNALEALVNAASEILDDYAGYGQRQKGEERQLRADGQHKSQRSGGGNNGVGRIHDRRAQQHTDGVEVVGGAGHDVAGAVALIVGVREALEVREQVVAQIEFDVASDGDNDQGVSEKFLPGHAGVKIVDGAAQDLRKEDPDSVIE